MGPDGSIESRDSVVGIAARLRAGRLKHRDFHTEKEDFYLLLSVRTECDAHKASYSAGTAGKAAGL